LPYPDDRQDEFECLNLFVVRPSKEALAKQDIDAKITRLPVLVWIHGGGFIDGAGTDPASGTCSNIASQLNLMKYPLSTGLYADPSRLVLRSLSNQTAFIAVSINYRLGIFGFGASSDMIAAQGRDSPLKGLNFGLHDQKLAFIWVKRNIAAFGGDGNKITIMGQSAGGISCYLHLLEVELGAGNPLFRKAGLMSGPVGYLELTSIERADQRWADLCRLWSVQADNPVDRVNMLRRIPTKDLLNSISDLHWVLFTLTMDGLTIRKSDLGCGVSVHLGHDELDDESKPSDEKVQVLMSAAAEEFRGFAMIAKWNYAIFHSLFTSTYPSVAAAEEVLQAYGISPTLSDEELLEAFSQFISDATMMYKIYNANEFLKNHRGKRALLRGQDAKRVGIQYYHFEFGNPFSGPMQGIAHHGVEMIYTFGNFHDALKEVDQGISERYSEPCQTYAEGTVGGLSVDTQATDYRKSNIDLSHELQDKLLQFVVEDCQETDQRAYADDIMTFCHDRSVCVESWSSGEKWASKRRKLQVLDKHRDSMISVTRKLVGNVIGMAL
jgi:carboxylesterase type B